MQIENPDAERIRQKMNELRDWMVRYRENGSNVTITYDYDWEAVDESEQSDVLFKGTTILIALGRQATIRIAKGDSGSGGES